MKLRRRLICLESIQSANGSVAGATCSLLSPASRAGAAGIVAAVLAIANSARAADDLKSRLTKAGKEISKMVVAASQLDSRETADFYAQVIKINLEKALDGERAVIQVKGLPGYCHVVIFTTEWRIILQAEKGKITANQVIIP